MILLDEISVCDSIETLTGMLRARPGDETLRKILFEEFLRYADYSSAEEWNRAVRICEALAIIGWGGHEPLEAVRDNYINGRPETFFVTANRKARFKDAVWTETEEGIMVNPSKTTFYASPDDPEKRKTVIGGYGSAGAVQNLRLATQRNWIAKNPVRITRTLDNCYPSTRPLIESIDSELQPMLDHGMRPETYGNILNYVWVNCAFSFFDNQHCKTNYVIASEDRKLRFRDYYPALLEMYTVEEIERDGLFLRPRYDIGPFRRDTGVVGVTIVFEREFSRRPLQEQKRCFADYLLTAMDRIADRFDRRRLSYDFASLRCDLRSILSIWLTSGD